MTTRAPIESSIVARAVEAWAAAVGPAHVTTEPASLDHASSATFRTESRIVAVVRPADRAQVQACMRIANELRVPVYPSSGGKNWGLGSRVPVQGEAALLSLDRMTRIVDFSEELAYVRVEAGVTFRQVHEFLESRGSELMLSVTGSSALGSLIGNAMERGHGFGPQADRFAHCQGAEVVLPTGECIHGGLERFEGASAARTYKWGLGPYVDGLFSQSNLGVVTELTFLLLPRPRDFRVVVASASGGRVPDFISALRTIRMDESFDIQLVNHSRQVNSLQAAGVPRAKWPARVREAPEDSWFATCAVYAPTADLGKARSRWIRGLLGPTTDSLHIIDESTRRFSRLLRRIGVLRGSAPNYTDPRRSHFVGHPSSSGVQFAYAAKPGAWRPGEEPDLDRDRVGIIWCAPVIPFTASHLEGLSRVTREVAARHGYPPDISLRPMNARTIDAIIGVAFDRDKPGEDERAVAWHDDLFQRLREAGALPYRLNVRSMALAPRAREGFDPFMAGLKRHLDPNDVLAPGRYDFRSGW